MSLVNSQGRTVVFFAPSFVQGPNVSNYEVPLESNPCSWGEIGELAEEQSASRIVRSDSSLFTTYIIIIIIIIILLLLLLLLLWKIKLVLQINNLEMKYYRILTQTNEVCLFSYKWTLLDAAENTETYKCTSLFVLLMWQTNGMLVLSLQCDCPLFLYTVFLT